MTFNSELFQTQGYSLRSSFTQANLKFYTEAILMVKTQKAHALFFLMRVIICIKERKIGHSCAALIMDT